MDQTVAGKVRLNIAEQRLHQRLGGILLVDYYSNIHHHQGFELDSSSQRQLVEGRIGRGRV